MSFCREQTMATKKKKSSRSAAKPTAKKTGSAKKKTSKKGFRSSSLLSMPKLPIVEVESRKSLRIRARLGLNRETFARMVPMSTRNLASIEGGKQASPTILRRLEELRRVINALSEVMKREAIGSWLKQPNDAFDGLKPIEVIERGEIDRIWSMIFLLRSGNPN